MRWLPGVFLGLQISGSANLPQANVAADYHRALQATGGTAPYHWSLHGGHVPAGLALSDDGIIAGRPELPGEFSLEVWVTDSAGHSAARRMTLPVAWSGLAIMTTNPELPWAQVGREYQIRFTAAGGLPSFSWKPLSPLPEGLKFSSDGWLAGSPARGGDFTVEVQASDLRGQSARRSFHLHISPAAVDQFGGVFALRSAVKPTGAWHMEKLNGRWVFITPEGHGFWMLGVYFVIGDGHNDDRGASYDQRTKSKYGAEAVKWLQANRRLCSWGFNTIGPYSYRMTLPFASEPQWGGEQPVKFPFVWMAQQAAISGRKEGIFKNLYTGVRGQDDASFPDVFDPAWVRHTYEITANNAELRAMAASQYFIGAFGDDTDYVAGFGPGTDFPTQPPDKVHAHLGYVALVTAPTQQTNPAGGQPYRDPKVYTKYKLRDFLQTKYGSIAALNAAWGSSYTTFDSDGGWPEGNGLLDENGRKSHGWLGRDDASLRGASAGVTQDLDEFLYQIARQFLSTECTAFRKVAPHALFFGPTTIGGWRAPARAPIYRAAREILDVISVSTDGSQEQLDFLARAAGDMPMIIWEGTTANPDSSQWRHPIGEPGAAWGKQTQAERAELYVADVERLFTGRSTVTGSEPFVGHLWWAWTDSVPEKRNWGLVSLMDNAYDGWEDGITQGTDAWGFPTGGEEKNFGDFLGPVRKENFSIPERLANVH